MFSFHFCWINFVISYQYDSFLISFWSSEIGWFHTNWVGNTLFPNWRMKRSEILRNLFDFYEINFSWIFPVSKVFLRPYIMFCEFSCQTNLFSPIFLYKYLNSSVIAQLIYSILSFVHYLSIFQTVSFFVFFLFNSSEYLVGSRMIFSLIIICTPYCQNFLKGTIILSFSSFKDYGIFQKCLTVILLSYFVKCLIFPRFYQDYWWFETKWSVSNAAGKSEWNFNFDSSIFPCAFTIVHFISNHWYLLLVSPP